MIIDYEISARPLGNIGFGYSSSMMVRADDLSRWMVTSIDHGSPT